MPFFDFDPAYNRAPALPPDASRRAAAAPGRKAMRVGRRYCNAPFRPVSLPWIPVRGIFFRTL